jgi:hypothetical protein
MGSNTWELSPIDFTDLKVGVLEFIHREIISTITISHWAQVQVNEFLLGQIGKLGFTHGIG